jgi:hypothetical protein
MSHKSQPGACLLCQALKTHILEFEIRRLVLYILAIAVTYQTSVEYLLHARHSAKS